MALKISGTEVFTNSRELVNTTGIDGRYTALHPTINPVPVSSGVYAIDFNYSVHNLVLAGNVAFQNSQPVSNVLNGKSTIILLDRSTNGHSVDFSIDFGAPNSTNNWVGGEPDWTTYRFWVISLLCWTSDSFYGIRGSAYGLSFS